MRMRNWVIAGILIISIMTMGTTPWIAIDAALAAPKCGECE